MGISQNMLLGYFEQMILISEWGFIKWVEVELSLDGQNFLGGVVNPVCVCLDFAKGYSVRK